jgi:hypothetical protein
MAVMNKNCLAKGTFSRTPTYGEPAVILIPIEVRDMKIRRVAIAQAALCMLVLCLTLGARTGEIWLEYGESGGMVLSKSSLTIDGDGNVTVQIEETKPLKYKTVLTPGEMNKLKEEIALTRFFELEQDKQFQEIVMDVPDRRLSIKLAGKNRELKFRLIKELDPLLEMLQRLEHQARLLGRTPFDVYQAMCAVSELAAAHKVLQPSALTQSFKDVAAGSSDWQKCTNAFEGLAWTISARDWLDFVTEQIKSAEGKRRETLFLVVSEYNFLKSLPKTHQTAMLGFYLKWLREFIGREKDLSSNERNAI